MNEPPEKSRNKLVIDATNQGDEKGGSSANPQQPSSAIGLLQQATLERLQPVSGMALTGGTDVSDLYVKPEFPLSAKDAIQFFGDVLTDYEKQEIAKFDK